MKEDLLCTRDDLRAWVVLSGKPRFDRRLARPKQASAHRSYQDANSIVSRTSVAPRSTRLRSRPSLGFVVHSDSPIARRPVHVTGGRNGTPSPRIGIGSFATHRKIDLVCHPSHSSILFQLGRLGRGGRFVCGNAYLSAQLFEQLRPLI